MVLDPQSSNAPALRRNLKLTHCSPSFPRESAHRFTGTGDPNFDVIGVSTQENESRSSHLSPRYSLRPWGAIVPILLYSCNREGIYQQYRNAGRSGSGTYPPSLSTITPAP